MRMLKRFYLFEFKLFFNKFLKKTVNFFRKGENGEHCIKRAICETTHIESMNDRQNRNDPDSFVKELLRVIFR